MPSPLEDDTDDEPPARSDRWTDLELENGEVVIYDADNHNAWIQSDDAVDGDGVP